MINKRFLFRIILVVLGIVPVILLELALRLFMPDLAEETNRFRILASQETGRNYSVIKEPDAELLWRLKPQKPLLGTEILNSHGFRGPDFDIAKPADTYRIIAIGDSRTFGFGVTDWSETFCGRLQSFLNTQEINRKIEVINLSVLGYSSLQGKKLFNSLGNRLSPDLVICWFGFNDMLFFHITDQESMEKNRKLISVTQVINELFLTHFLRQNIQRYFTSPDVPLPETQRIVRRVPLDEYEHHLMELADSVHQIGAKVLFLTTPVRPEIPMILNSKIYQIQGDDGRTYERIQCQYDIDGFWLMDQETFPGTEDQLDILLTKYSQFPILHYYKAVFLEARGDAVGAREEKKRADELDTERVAVAQYNEKTRAAAAQAGAFLLDLVPPFDQHSEYKLFVDDCHPNGNGHHLITREIVSALSGKH